MSRHGLHILTALLGLIAFAAIAYTAWSERAKRLDLETRYETLLSDNEYLNTQLSAYQQDIYNKLLSTEMEALLQLIVLSETEADRAILFSQLELDILENYVQYGAATEIFVRLQALVEAPTQGEREDIRDRFLTKVQDMRPFNDDQKSVLPGPDEAKTISTLVTSLIAASTALGSLVTFLMSGAQRRVDDALAEVTLEKAKIELVQMRYDAREALNHMQGKPTEDPS